MSVLAKEVALAMGMTTTPDAGMGAMEEVKESDGSVLRAVRLAMENIVQPLRDGWMGTGSFVTEGIAGRSSSLLRELARLNQRPVMGVAGRESLAIARKLNFIKPEEMTAEDYVMSTLVTSLAPNQDYFAYTNDDPVKVGEMVKGLLWLARAHSGYKPTVIGSSKYFDRLARVNLQAFDDVFSGGANWMLLGPDWKERHVTFWNYRDQAQTGLVYWDQGGIWVYPREEQFTDDLRMELVPKNWDEWARQVAIGIRLAVMKGLGGRVDVRNIVERRPQEGVVGFETAVGVATNLAVAELHNPGLTSWLIKALGLREHLGKVSEVEMREILGGAEARWYGEGQDGLTRLLSGKLAKHMIVSQAELEEIVPKPEKRERFVGVEVAHGSRNKQMEGLAVEGMAMAMESLGRQGRRDEHNLIANVRDRLMDRLGMVDVYPDVLASVN